MAKKTQKADRSRKGGRKEKMEMVAGLINKDVARKDIIEALGKKYKGMSPAYAATVIQLTRQELGISGRRPTSKKSKKATTKSTTKTTKKSTQKAAKSATKTAAKSSSKKAPSDKKSKDAFENW